MGPKPGDKDKAGTSKDTADPKGSNADEKQKEHLARGIRADRNADDPKQSLLDALGDYMVLCGGDSVNDEWRVEMKMRTNGGTAGSYDVYYFNPEGVRFRSRAEAVRHYGLVPIAAPKGASRSQPGASLGKRSRPEIERKPGETLEQVKARRDALEVQKVMDRMLSKVEHLALIGENATKRDAERAKARAEKEKVLGEEKAVKEAKRMAEKAERDAVKEAEKAAKDKERAIAEEKRLAEKAAKEAEKERAKQQREAEKLERDKLKEGEKERKEAVRLARERRKVEDAENEIKEKLEAKTKGRWLRQSDAVREDGDAADAPKGPDTPTLALSNNSSKNPTQIPTSLLQQNPSFAGDTFEVWGFLNRFSDILFAEDWEANEMKRKKLEQQLAKNGKTVNKKKSKKQKAAAAAAAAVRAKDVRAPAVCCPPTPESLAQAAVSGDETAAAAVCGALLFPLIEAHAAASNSQTWFEATGVAPFREAFYVDSGGVGSADGSGGSLTTQTADVAWQELLRRYFRGAAASMASPPEGGLLGSTVRAGADMGETVCRWITSGGGTVCSTQPETGTVLPPALAASLMADLEFVPRPPAALSAKADAEALSICEAELFAIGGGVFEGNDTTDDTEEKQSARRAEALRVISEAYDAPITNSIRQTIRVLAHDQLHRAPQLSKKAQRNIGETQAASVPEYASVAGGAGFVLAARSRFPRVTDYEVIDARASAGVYAVSTLTSGQTSDCLLTENAAECGEFLKTAGADKSTPRVVAQKIEKAWKRGQPENDFPEVAEDAIDSGTAMDTDEADVKDEPEQKRGVGRPRLHPLPEEPAAPEYVTINGGTYTLFGSKKSSLPKVAWDDGCLCCGGDTFGGMVVLLCEECDGEYHAQCLNPQLRDVPDDDWFCPSCVRRKGEGDDDVKQKHSSPSPLRALEGTRLEIETSGDVTVGVKGSTRARTTQAKRNLYFAEMLTNKGGWAGITPGDRLEIMKELTWHLLECSTLRASLDESEKRANEARDNLRRHVRDWPSYRKHGISQAEASVIVANARLVAEQKEEELEAIDLAEKARKKAERDLKAAEQAASGENKDDKDDDEKGDEEMEDPKEDEEMEEEEDGKDEKDGEDTKDSKKKKGAPLKSYRVRMAAAEAARVCLRTIPEDEGRARWQAKWHELESALRSVDSRTETIGVDRKGETYWLVGDWGLLVTQANGGDAGAVATKPLGPGTAPGKKPGPKKRKRKDASGNKNEDDDKPDEDEDDVSDDEKEKPDDGEAEAKASAALLSVNAKPQLSGGGKDVNERPWGLYSDASEIRSLIKKLDSDGRFEQSLWTQLERRFGAVVFQNGDSGNDELNDEETNEKDVSDSEGSGGETEAEEEVDEAKDDHPQATLVPVADLVVVPEAPKSMWKKLAGSAGKLEGVATEGSTDTSTKTDPSTVAQRTMDQIKTLLLSFDGSIPSSQNAQGGELGQIAGYTKTGGCQKRREAWRVMVKQAKTPVHLAMALCLLEHGLRRECFKPEWLLWSSPAPALRIAACSDQVAAASSVLLRAKTLRRAVHWSNTKKTSGAQKNTQATDSPPVMRLSREERAKQRADATAAADIAAAIAASTRDAKKE